MHSNGQPPRKQQAKPSTHATARMHPASDKQSKPSKPKGKPLQMIRQGFALVSDTKTQQAYKTKKPKKGPLAFEVLPHFFNDQDQSRPCNKGQ
jgi:hypothetical protein